jgi:predicted ATPase with chaperone activity
VQDNKYKGFYGSSTRGHDRILKVACTIADLVGSEKIHPAHVAGTVNHCNLDREE